MPLTLSPPAGEVIVTGPAPALTMAFVLRPPAGVIELTPGRPTLSIGGFVVTPAGTGNPSYPFTLFRGQVTGVKMSRRGELLTLVLDCEDYNRLFPLTKVGAPVFGNFLHQPSPPPDGTDIAIDGNGQVEGDQSSPALFVSKFTAYCAGIASDTSTHISAISASGSLPDFSTNSSDFKSFADTLAAYMGPYVRWWLDADLALQLTELAPVGTVGRFAVTAPWSLDEDSPPSAGVIGLSMGLTANWDFSKIRKRIFIRGGTPESAIWVTNPAAVPPLAGEEYHDASGALTADDALAVALFQFAAVYRRMLSGTAHIESGHDGWRPGQTLYVTSARLSTPGRELAATPTIIQSVSGHLVGPGPGLALTLGGVTLDNVTWPSFSFANAVDGPEKATITVEIVDPSHSLVVSELEDVKVTTNGQPTIEYDLTYGDIAAGDIAKALLRYKDPDPTTKVLPVYDFAVTVDDPHMPAPASGFNVTLVTAQLLDGAGKPRALAGVIVQWVILQWVDDALTLPGDTYSLADATGTTDAMGRVYTDLARAADDATTSVAYKIKPVALPV